jgi:hypothetical protein
MPKKLTVADTQPEPSESNSDSSAPSAKKSGSSMTDATKQKGEPAVGSKRKDPPPDTIEEEEEEEEDDKGDAFEEGRVFHSPEDAKETRKKRAAKKPKVSVRSCFPLPVSNPMFIQDDDVVVGKTEPKKKKRKSIGHDIGGLQNKITKLKKDYKVAVSVDKEAVAIIETTKKLISQQAKAQKLTDTEKIRSLLSDLSKHPDKYDGEPFTITEKKKVINAETKKEETIDTTRGTTILHEMAALLRAVATHIDPTNENAEKLKKDYRKFKSEYTEKKALYEKEIYERAAATAKKQVDEMNKRYSKAVEGELSD